MAQTIFEELSGRCERQGDYILHCLTVPSEEENPIGVFGQINNIRACAREIVNKEIIFA